MKTTTVFVRRVCGVFTASTSAASAEHTSSASLAARTAAARHFGVPENRIELATQSQGILRASVRQPARDRAWGVLAASAALVAATGLATWIALQQLP
ncbi:MAG: hypothetical protein HZA93_24110 [Verrucomicrobia bacterium]|nr:hypothetical protein [Verrucomicrobiota bacterium]